MSGRKELRLKLEASTAYDSEDDQTSSSSKDAACSANLPLVVTSLFACVFVYNAMWKFVFFFIRRIPGRM